MIVLGIETSCDETSIAIYNNKKKMLLNEIYYKINIAKRYGGTVPELSSRDHNKKILAMILLVLKKLNLKLKELDVIAYTKGPGLIGSLLVGATLAKSLALSLNIPSIGINHLEAHVLINKLYNKDLVFPFVSLIVSGGHTLLLQAYDYLNFKLIGETIDDSAGETFDKIARLLNFKSISGKNIEYISNNRNFSNYNFPKSLIKKGCFDFSFSGIKTFTKHLLRRKITHHDFDIANFVYNFQNTIIKIISYKCLSVLRHTKCKNIVLAGGVSSNKQLRKELINISDSLDVKCYITPIKYCTDNGAMIAFSGFLKYSKGIIDKDFSIDVFCKKY